MSEHTGELLVTFTRNVYTDDTLRLARVPLLEDGGVGPLPTTSKSMGFKTARASATAVVAQDHNEGLPAMAFSYGTADTDPFEVHTAFYFDDTSPPSVEQQTVPITSIPNFGGLSMAAAVAMACCDGNDNPVLAYTRRPSIYESYLAFATLQTKKPNTTTTFF